MTILELDVGNSRIKWRLSALPAEDQPVSGQGVIDAPLVDAALFSALSAAWQGIAMAKVEKVRVSNVRGPGFEHEFSDWLHCHWGLQAVYARVLDSRAGLRHAYREGGALGVDRWLAMLAAYHEVKAACVIVDCGTAITVDVVEADGGHLGGYIVPGLGKMRDSLLSGTQGIRFRDEYPWCRQMPGKDTGEAVSHGILRMVVDFLHGVERDYPAGRRVTWFLCGGDAAVVERQLQFECRHVPHLVLDGLALALE